MPSNWLYIDTNFPTFTGEESTDEKVTTIQNYLFMLVEQLRYSLHNLDTRNMNQTALSEFTRDLTEPIYGRIEDTEGNLTELAVTAKGIAARVSDAEGNISSLQMTATSLASQIQDANGNISILQQTATSLSSTVANQAGQISAINQKADSISATVTNQAGQISNLTQTAQSISATVANQAGQISQVQQTVNGLTVSVASPYGGSTTMINGGSIYTDNLHLDRLYGNYIYVNDAYGQIAAIITATGASSYAGQKFLLSSGAVEIDAGYGDIFLYSSNGTLQIGGGQAAVGCDLVPRASNMYNCGTYGFRWNDVYTTNGPVSSSDREGKEEIDYDMSRYSGLFDRLRPCSFLRTDGTSGRRHHGLIAQDVLAAMKAEGMTGKDFAGYVAWESPEEAGCGLRYEEMIAMLVYEVQQIKKQNGEINKRLGI